MSEKITIDKELAISTAQLVTNMAALLFTVSGLAAIGIAGISRGIMLATGAEGSAAVLKADPEYLDMVLNYNNKLTAPLNEEIKNLKAEIATITGEA